MKKALPLFLLYILLLPIGALAQSECTGNLGENIFETGDFGSGVANIVPVDPGIAPGYIYTTSPPPFDGYYLITNSMALWNNIYGDWFTPSDNSSDPNGYMMVVNASYSPGVFYLQNVDNLCENTLYEFSADILNIDRQELSGRIRPNVSFFINGEEQFSTGDIINDESWHTFGFSFSTGPGEFSVELSLVNNAPGGLGNDLALDNISFRACGPEALILPEEIENICEDGEPITLNAAINGDQFGSNFIQWQISYDGGVNWEDLPGETGTSVVHDIREGGDYHYRFLVAGDASGILNPKCRIISNSKVVRVIPRDYLIIDSLCQGLSYFQGDRIYNQSGIYVDSFMSVYGCDSIVTLDLTFVPDAGIVAGTSVSPVTCFGFEDGSIQVSDIENATPPVQFGLTDPAMNTLMDFTNLAAGVYHLAISDRYGCSFEQDLEVTAPLPFVVDLGPDLSISLGESLEISVVSSTLVQTYNWEPSDLIDCEMECTSITITPPATTEIVLQALSENNCQASDTLLIEVDDQPRLYIPNAFSPNNDGINDFFNIQGFESSIEEVEELMVFNRWGGIVFQDKGLVFNDLNAGWDGKVNGQPAAAGVYTYVATLRLINGVVHRVWGSVSLVR